MSDRILRLSIETTEKRLTEKLAECEKIGEQLTYTKGTDAIDLERKLNSYEQEAQALAEKLDELTRRQQSASTERLLNGLQPYFVSHRPLIARIYRQSLPRRSENTAMPTALNKVVSRLSVPAPGRLYSCLVRFVGYLLLSGELVDIAAVLNDWLASQVEDPNQLLAELVNEQTALAAQQQRSCLLVRVKPSTQGSAQTAGTKRYFVWGWFVQDVAFYRENFPSGVDPITPPESSPDETFTLAGVEAQLRKLYATCSGECTSVQVFLPSELMNQGIDTWPIEAVSDEDEFCPTFGTDHRVMVRCEYRLKPKYRRNEWGRRWTAIRDYQQPVEQAFAAGDGTNLKALYGQLNRAGMLGLRLTCVPRQVGKTSVFDMFAQSSAPVAIWLRQQLVGRTCCTVIDGVLVAAPLQALPETIKETRNDGFGDDAHEGSHLSLVWDDPFLVPPDCVQPQIS